MNAPTFRFALRAATQDLHQRLDDSVGSFADLAGYSRYLRGLCAFRSWGENCLPAALPYGDWQPTRAATQLAADLADLGLTPRPVPPVVPIAAPEALLGHLYVLEGASIGARLLQRRAAEIGFGPEHGARHLAHQAGSEGWHGFAQILAQSDPAALPEATKAARHAFALAIQIFEEA